MHQPPQVVEGLTTLRGKFRGPGVHQVQGQDEFGHLLQGFIDRGIFQVGFPGRLAIQQFRHLPLVDAAGVGIYRDDLPGGNGLGGHLGIQEGGQGKFPAE